MYYDHAISKLMMDGYKDPKWYEKVWWWIREKTRLYDLFYWFSHRFIMRHRYHLIDTGLPVGYHDIPERMLYGMFQMLINFVDREKCFERVDFKNSGGEWPEVEKEIRYLYRWWKEIRPKRSDPWIELCRRRREEGDPIKMFRFENPDENGNRSMILNDLDPEAKSALEYSHSKDLLELEEDKENLIRLIKIRNYLWT